MEKKIILHLCADLGSDSRYYQLDDDYEVILVGQKTWSGEMITSDFIDIKMNTIMHGECWAVGRVAG